MHTISYHKYLSCLIIFTRSDNSFSELTLEKVPHASVLNITSVTFKVLHPKSDNEVCKPATVGLDIGNVMTPY